MINTVCFCNYSIGANAYDEVAATCKFYGKKVLLIGGEKALAAGKARLEAAIEDSGLAIVATELYGHDCTYAHINRLATMAKELNVDMIFGMGGGKALDTAKGAADVAGLPIFTFPTIAATCAGITKLSIIYREDGSFEEMMFFDRPARHCFIDLTIIAEAPAIYLQAGMGDTLGKHFECHFSSRNDELAHGSALAREISNMCYLPIKAYGAKALQDCKNNICSAELKEAVLANVVSTGLVSLLVEDCYNGAVAHSVYYALVSLPGFEHYNLHGNVVAYGILVQLAVDGEMEQAAEFKKFLQSMEIRTTLEEMHAPADRASLEEVLKLVVTGPDMQHIPYPINEDMIYDAMMAVEKL
ncbi:MAG: iron-containing alcohol dehydrogenase family protein [Phascolarctobacterium sp.]|nr:iron-containing alcohol dehydrogenase family protein [Phascolarctobacterium sp.]